MDCWRKKSYAKPNRPEGHADDIAGGEEGEILQLSRWWVHDENWLRDYSRRELFAGTLIPGIILHLNLLCFSLFGACPYGGDYDWRLSLSPRLCILSPHVTQPPTITLHSFSTMSDENDEMNIDEGLLFSAYFATFSCLKAYSIFAGNGVVRRKGRGFKSGGGS